LFDGIERWIVPPRIEADSLRKGDRKELPRREKRNGALDGGQKDARRWEIRLVAGRAAATACIDDDDHDDGCDDGQGDADQDCASRKWH
jgi:hypothetical protein